MSKSQTASIKDVKAASYRFPTETPESDGTLSWDATTLVLATVSAGGEQGIGYTYDHQAAASLIETALREVLVGLDAFDIPHAVTMLQRRVRNIGRSGVAACAISALDVALWDLKAKLLGVPLARLFGQCRDRVLIYGSGGFTSYNDQQLRDQLGGWVAVQGCKCVKMKIGREPDRDPHRVAVARQAIGDIPLFVDANGALSVKQALLFAERTREQNIRWFEEPASSDAPTSLRLLRERLPAEMEVAAGEYIYNLDDARILLEAGAVDVLQADATRSWGYTGFLAVDALCQAHHIDLSAHCAPALHLPVVSAVRRLRHIEWFHDHVRLEHALFDGAPDAHDGYIKPDLSRPGHGLEFKTKDAERYRIGEGSKG